MLLAELPPCCPVKAEDRAALASRGSSVTGADPFTSRFSVDLQHEYDVEHQLTVLQLFDQLDQRLASPRSKRLPPQDSTLVNEFNPFRSRGPQLKAQLQDAQFEEWSHLPHMCVRSAFSSAGRVRSSMTSLGGASPFARETGEGISKGMQASSSSSALHNGVNGDDPEEDAGECSQHILSPVASRSSGHASARLGNHSIYAGTSITYPMVGFVRGSPALSRTGSASSSSSRKKDGAQRRGFASDGESKQPLASAGFGPPSADPSNTAILLQPPLRASLRIEGQSCGVLHRSEDGLGNDGSSPSNEFARWLGYQGELVEEVVEADGHSDEEIFALDPPSEVLFPATLRSWSRTTDSWYPFTRMLVRTEQALDEGPAESIALITPRVGSSSASRHRGAAFIPNPARAMRSELMHQLLLHLWKAAVAPSLAILVTDPSALLQQQDGSYGRDLRLRASVSTPPLASPAFPLHNSSYPDALLLTQSPNSNPSSLVAQPPCSPLTPHDVIAEMNTSAQQQNPTLAPQLLSRVSTPSHPDRPATRAVTAPSRRTMSLPLLDPTATPPMLPDPPPPPPLPSPVSSEGLDSISPNLAAPASLSTTPTVYTKSGGAQGSPPPSNTGVPLASLTPTSLSRSSSQTALEASGNPQRTSPLMMTGNGPTLAVNNLLNTTSGGGAVASSSPSSLAVTGSMPATSAVSRPSPRLTPTQPQTTNDAKSKRPRKGKRRRRLHPDEEDLAARPFEKDDVGSSQLGDSVLLPNREDPDVSLGEWPPVVDLASQQQQQQQQQGSSGAMSSTVSGRRVGQSGRQLSFAKSLSSSSSRSRSYNGIFSSSPPRSQRPFSGRVDYVTISNTGLMGTTENGALPPIPCATAELLQASTHFHPSGGGESGGSIPSSPSPQPHAPPPPPSSAAPVSRVNSAHQHTRTGGSHPRTAATAGRRPTHHLHSSSGASNSASNLHPTASSQQQHSYISPMPLPTMLMLATKSATPHPMPFSNFQPHHHHQQVQQQGSGNAPGPPPSSARGSNHVSVGTRDSGGVRESAASGVQLPSIPTDPTLRYNCHTTNDWPGTRHQRLVRARTAHPATAAARALPASLREQR